MKGDVVLVCNSLKHLPPNAFHINKPPMVSPLLASTTSNLPKHSFTASLLSYPHIVGNPAIHPAALALVTCEVDRVRSPVNATSACCWYIFPALLSSSGSVCLVYIAKPFYINSISPFHSLPYFYTVTPRGQGAVTRLSRSPSDRPLAAMELILGLHACWPSSATLARPTLLPHD